MADQFATVMRRFRLRAGLTQEALAQRSGVSVSTIRGMETGKRRNPQLTSVRQLAAALGLTDGEQDELLAAATGRPVAATPVPRQLPAPPAPFAGRQDVLDQVGTAGISVISGAGGIGKSWLALHWAHRNAARFPDGQLFVDLRGFSPGSAPMDPAAAVRGFLDALGVEPSRLPADPHAQAAMFRGLVADRRVLLVLDNAADTAQVVPLLPGTGTCAVVVTSRSTLTGLITGHGAHHMSVGTLTADEASSVLTARLGSARVEAEPDAAAELIGRCGGFPLALSIVAGRACVQPHLTLAALALELRESTLDALDDIDPAASLPAVLSSSHRALTAEQAEVFSLLAIAPGPDISLPAAMRLTGLGEHRTRTVLRALTQASLVVQDANGRYRMHDLIRRYAADLAGDTSDALQRLLGFYAHTAAAADTVVETHRHLIDLAPSGATPLPMPDIGTAMTWFIAEHANLLAAQRVAAERGHHARAWEIAWGLNNFHYRQGHRHDQLSAWRTGAASAAHLDPLSLALALRLLGRALVVLGHNEEAIAHMQRALELAEEQGDAPHQGHAHYTLASAWEREGEDRKALDHARQALTVYRSIGQAAWEGNALNAVGWFHARLGEHDAALEHCHTALALYRRIEDLAGQAQTLDSLGFTEHQRGTYAEAIGHYQEAVALYRVLGNVVETADTLERLGDSHFAVRERAEARSAWEEALELYRQQGRTEEASLLEKRLT
ncbi:tetratricopeptide repeat protein [Lentzea sp. BCCO 10_0061]|uniref:Tetratricopeptide repeat protein n=1 Tax=Lentzea sokolovensis TaxID=3095429 RepID=A0ABU4UNY4_9PSEU|nr:tetratricopeptide repeat protein [Lentzea sp. BCCO 10_0061]MDX8141205.1 tetratricopeptide repeat protein [Lentzea sp. BCCO 10_0061]